VVGVQAEQVGQDGREELGGEVDERGVSCRSGRKPFV
jgi:hypothetical protein